MTISDVKILNRKAGRHFFDHETMKFFSSKIESSLLKGNYFITSEKPPRNPRYYVIRRYNPNNHHILMIQDDFKTVQAAHTVVCQLQLTEK